MPNAAPCHFSFVLDTGYQMKMWIEILDSALPVCAVLGQSAVL